MIQPFRSTSAESQSDARGEVVLLQRFDYSPLADEVAQWAQMAAQRIRLLLQRTLEDVLAVGQELLAVKDALPHGEFSIWLRAEFDWTERTARRFMAVAERFGSKSDTMSLSKIDLSAAYMLAAPSAPEEASTAALRRAMSGERITTSVAKEILGSVRRTPERRERASSAEFPAEKLWGQLLEVLESFRRQWDPRQAHVLARQLRDFADSVEEE